MKEVQNRYATVVVDLKGIIRSWYVPPGGRNDFIQRDIVGKHIDRTMPDADAMLFLECIRLVLKKGKSKTLTHALVFRDSTHEHDTQKHCRAVISRKSPRKVEVKTRFYP